MISFADWECCFRVWDYVSSSLAWVASTSHLFVDCRSTFHYSPLILSIFLSLYALATRQQVNPHLICSIISTFFASMLGFGEIIFTKCCRKLCPRFFFLFNWLLAWFWIFGKNICGLQILISVVWFGVYIFSRCHKNMWFLCFYAGFSVYLWIFGKIDMVYFFRCFSQLLGFEFLENHLIQWCTNAFNGLMW